MVLKLKKNNPGCRCCPGDGNCVLITTTDCGNPLLGSGQGDASYYTLTMSGLSNSNCAYCDTWNGEFKISATGALDEWASPSSDLTYCGKTAGDPLYTLSRSGGYYNLTANGLGYVWRTATADWSCVATETLTLQEPTPVPAPCSSVPTTVDLIPCVKCIHCTNSQTATPNEVQIDISGLTHKACDCTNLNATFTLSDIPGSCGRYYFSDDTYTCQGHPLGCPEELAIYAEMNQLIEEDYPNRGWRVYIHIGRISWGDADCPRSIIRYYWSSGGTGTFDCMTARTGLTLYSNTDNYFCNDWESASIDLTPL